MIGTLYGYQQCKLKKYTQSSISLPYFAAQNSIIKPRIFLVGDSIVGQICREVLCVPGAQLDIQPRIVVPNNTWYLLREHAVKLSQGEISKAYHLAYFRLNVSIFREEIYQGFRPTPLDIMVILVGTHSNKVEYFKTYIKSLYEDVALPFPGRVFWIEPLPQHFKTGRYIEKPKPLTDCFPWTQASNLTQFWRKETVNTVVQETANIKIIRAYDKLAPLWNCHKLVPANKELDFRDCTHYLPEVYASIIQALTKAIKQHK